MLPLKDHCKEVLRPLDDAQKNLFKMTRCFPLAYSKTILFNMSKPISPL